MSECAELHWRDIDIEQRRIYVRGKGMKERPVPLSAVLLDYLLPNTGGNVLTGSEMAYTGATLQRKVNRLMARAGVNHLPRPPLHKLFTSEILLLQREVLWLSEEQEEVTVRCSTF